MKLQCEFDYSCRLKNVSCRYICEVVDVTKKSEKHKLEVITREHVPGKTNADVKILRIRMKPLKVIPKGLFQMFPNLRMVTIVDCGIKAISREDLVGLESLEFLNLSRNKIKSLPDDLFADTKNLREIYFDNNRIEFMSSKIFAPIEGTLKKAVFAGNARIKETFDQRDPFRENLTQFKEIVDLSCLPPPKSVAESRETLIDESNHREQMCETFSSFKATGNFSDTVLKFRGRKFKVHSRILSSQSPVFQKIFSANSFGVAKVSEKTLNVSESSFESFVDFFYSGRCSPEVNVAEIFELATIFELSKLKETCIARILADLNESNALEVFNMAHRRNSDELKLTAFKIIQKMIPDVPNHLIGKPNKISKLVSLKQESDAALKKIIAEDIDEPATGAEESKEATKTERRRGCCWMFNIFRCCSRKKVIE